MTFLTRINDWIDRLAAGGVIALLAAMVLIITAQVIGRNVVFYSLPWSEEAARYIMIWISCLGASVAFRRGGHIGMEFVKERLPGRWARAAEIVMFAIVGVVAWVLVKEGITVTKINVRQLSPAMRLRMSYPYSALPTLGVLVLLQCIEGVLRSAVHFVTGSKPEPVSTDPASPPGGMSL